MRSVADIPPGDDADDELSGISPELVLVDPELARLVREREPALPAAEPKRTPTLRLVPIEPSEPAIVPRPAAPAPPVVGEPTVEPTVVPPAAPPSVETRPEPPAPAAPSDPPALAAPAVERPAEARPVWIAEPAPAAPAEQEPRPESRPAAIPAAMPHPVARPATVTRHAPPPRAPRSRGRGVMALVAAIAVASLAVLGITRLDGGLPLGSSGSGEATAVPPGTPPTAKKAAGTQPKAGASTKPGAKAATKAKARPTKKAVRTTPSPSKTAQAPAAKAKATQRAKAKASATKPKASTTPKAAAAKPKPSGATAPAAAAEPRRFAWAPVAGAIGYHVELFRGANRVLEKETTEPILELGPSWQYEGRTNRLTQGSYRWYVWPVTRSGRSSQAVVQATLDVP